MDLDNFIIGKIKERRGEERFGKKSNNYLANIEQQLMEKIAKKQTAVTWLEDPCRSTKQQLLNKHIYMLTVNKHQERNNRVHRI